MSILSLILLAIAAKIVLTYLLLVYFTLRFSISSYNMLISSKSANIIHQYYYIFFIFYIWRIFKNFAYRIRELRKWLSRKLYEE